MQDRVRAISQSTRRSESASETRGVTDFVVVRGQVQHVAVVHPRTESQHSGLRVVRPMRGVRLTVYAVLHRFYPDHGAGAVQHAVDARPVVFHVCVHAAIREQQHLCAIVILIFFFIRQSAS